MGHPASNPQGYSDSSILTHIPLLRAPLLLIHGLIDENVHFRHSARLINALIAHRKRYELVLFPCERHSPHNLEDKVYLEDIMWDFFIKHLLPVPVCVPVPLETPVVVSVNKNSMMKISAHL